MQEYDVIFTEEAKEDLLKIDNSIRKIIFNKIEILKVNPDFGRPLRKDLKGYRKLVVSKYRVVYSIEKDRLSLSVIVSNSQ